MKKKLSSCLMELKNDVAHAVEHELKNIFEA